MHEFIYVHVVCVLNCDCFVCVCVCELEEVRETARPEERNPHPHPPSTPPLVVLTRGWIPADVKQCSNGLSWMPRPTSRPLVSRCFLSPPSDLHPSSSSPRPPIHHSRAFFLGGKVEDEGWSDSRTNSLGLWRFRVRDGWLASLQSKCFWAPSTNQPQVLEFERVPRTETQQFPNYSSGDIYACNINILTLCKILDSMLNILQGPLVCTVKTKLVL